jgi:hypothetical protein
VEAGKALLRCRRCGVLEECCDLLSACGRSVVVMIPLCILPDTPRIAVWVHGHYLRSDECAPVITASLRLRGGITRPTLGPKRAS